MRKVRWLMAFIISLLFLIFVLPSMAYMTGKEAHEKYIYPVVRVATNSAAGSGTIVYSRGDEIFDTYVITNFHVISDAIRIIEEWDSDLEKDVKREKRSIVYVEIFKYQNLSTPIGTLKVEADILDYNRDEDMALLKLRTQDEARYVSPLTPDTQYNVMDETVAVGCSLGFPPMPTTGVITRLNFQISSLPGQPLPRPGIP